jgi:nitrate/TMAO reductase-like tetraheme cytochrome c subunit
MKPIATVSTGPRVALCALAALLAAPFAHAEDEHRAATPLLPKYRQECASCHIAYPPGALPAESWQRLMRNLPHHFGTDASLDAATTKEISGWLAANAGSWRRVAEAPPQDRITQSSWFIRKHRELAPTTWRLPAVKSPSNCAACHRQAEQGDFDEDRVRIPR